MEHARLINKIQTENRGNREFQKNNNIKSTINKPNKYTVVADMMAGVGPFAIPLAMQTEVLAVSNSSLALDKAANKKSKKDKKDSTHIDSVSPDGNSKTPAKSSSNVVIVHANGEICY